MATSGDRNEPISGGENSAHLSDAELLADRVASKVVSVPNILYAVVVANIGCLLFGYEVGAGEYSM